jgi:predicted amidohydrolase
MKYSRPRNRIAACTVRAAALALLVAAGLPFAATAQTPYSGSPIAIPGSFEAEDFDLGGEGVAYHDNIPGNSGGQYRTNEDVDIVADPQAGFVVNNFETGEWLGYTISVPADGNYDIELQAATSWDFPDAAFHVEIDGVNVTGTVTLPDTGGWNSFQWLGKRTVSLAAGTRLLKVVSDRQYFNLNSIRLTGPSSAQAQELMPASASSWSPFAPRPQSAPGTAVSNGTSGYALDIHGLGVPNVYGGWTTRIAGLQGGSHYRFRARALPSGIASLRESVTIILRWRGSFADGVMPDYVWDFRRQDDGTILFDRVIQAPGGTTAVDVELVLQWAPNGQVAFDALSFAAAAPPPARKVRVVAVHYRPAGADSGYASVEQAARYAEQVASAYRPDIMVLGEMLNRVGAPGSLDSNAETVPGPSTDLMARVARAYRVNIVFGMVESLDNLIHNTAVLLDRDGNITGKYRKVQLPLSEASAGLAPGSSVPVFDTDFGRVALLICHDTSFPEPAREAALQGAELLLVPIWGGRAALVHARAVENGVYLAASGYDYPSEVVSSLGAVLASVAVDGGPQAAVADIDLSQRFQEALLGDWRDISNKERRVEPYQFRVP